MTSDEVIESYFRHGTGQNSRFLFVHSESVAIPVQEADNMPHSTLYHAKRALVSVLLRLAAACGLALEITRESDDGAVLQAYRRVAKKVHQRKARDMVGDTTVIFHCAVPKDLSEMGVLGLRRPPPPHRFLQVGLGYSEPME